MFSWRCLLSEGSSLAAGGTPVLTAVPRLLWLRTVQRPEKKELGTVRLAKRELPGSSGCCGRGVFGAGADNQVQSTLKAERVV